MHLLPVHPSDPASLPLGVWPTRDITDLPIAPTAWMSFSLWGAFWFSLLFSISCLVLNNRKFTFPIVSSMFPDWQSFTKDYGWMSVLSDRLRSGWQGLTVHRLFLNKCKWMSGHGVITWQIHNKWKEDLICIACRSAMKLMAPGYRGCQKIMWLEQVVRHVHGRTIYLGL